MSPLCPFCAHCKGDDRLSAQLYFLHIFPYAQGTGNHFSWCQMPQQSPFCWNLTSSLSYTAAAGLSLSHACNCYLWLMQLAGPQAERYADGSCHRKIFQYHIWIGNTDHIHENNGTAGSKKRKTAQPSRYAIALKIERVRKKQSGLLLSEVYGIFVFSIHIF